MRITQAELDRYRRELDRRSSAAKAYVAQRVRDECRGMTVAKAREHAIEVMRDCNGVFGDQAQELAAGLFDEVCQAEGIDATSEVFDGVIDEQMMEEKVRYYADGLKDGDWRGYGGSLSDLAAYYVKRAAYESMVRNCDRNNVRYARVGTGRETCGWCFMLSSRGFVYHSEELASHGMHQHCDCVVVPGRRGVTRIQGYDPEGMRRRWAMCVDATGGYPDGAEIKARWDAMSDEERAAYKGGWKRFSQLEYSRAARAEAELHDPEWLYTGTCVATRKAAIPEVASIRELYPEEYASWQFKVSYGKSYAIAHDQDKHIPQTHMYDDISVKREPPSFFTLGLAPDFDVHKDKLTANEVEGVRGRVDELIRQRMGTGVPNITRKGKWDGTEGVMMDEVVGVNARDGSHTRRVRFMYGKSVHVVPTAEGVRR